jgi:serine/threonine protein kinase
MKRKRKRPDKHQRQLNRSINHPSNSTEEAQQLQDAEQDGEGSEHAEQDVEVSQGTQDGEGSEGALGNELHLTSLAGSLSAGQQLKLQKQVQKLQLQLQQEKQMQLKKMQQQHQQTMQQVNQRHQAQLAAMLGDTQGLQQTREQLQLEVQQLRAHLQAVPGRQSQQPGVGQLPGQQQQQQLLLLQQQPMTYPAAAAAPAEPAAADGHGSFRHVMHVKLTKVYDNSLPPDLFVRLEQHLGGGATATVCSGVVVYSNGQPVLTFNGQAMEPVKVAVKVFVAPAVGPQHLLQVAKHELTVLQLLQGQPAAVRLVGEGVLGEDALLAPAAAAAGSSSAAAAAAAAAAEPPQCAHCIVQELAICSVEKALEQTGPVPEQVVQKHTRHLVQLLEQMQSSNLQLNTAHGSVPVTIVHRDIKPENLLVRRDGSIVMGDFGLASIQQQQQLCQVMPPAGQQQGYQDNDADDQEMDYAAMPRVAATAAAPAAVLGGPGAMHSLVGTAHYMTPELTKAALDDKARRSAAAAGGGGGGGCPGPHAAAACSLDGAATRFCYDASVDTYALGVSSLAMLVGNLKYMDRAAGLGYGDLEVQDLRLAAFVNDDVDELQRLLPQAVGIQVSSAAREFVGCCCGVGDAREAAAAAGQPKRLTPAQLLQLPWMQTVHVPVEQG